MKLTLVLLLVVMTAVWLAPGAVHSEDASRCTEAPKVIEPVRSGPQFEAFRTWLKAHEAASDLDSGELGLHERFDSEGKLHSSPMSAANHIALEGVYIADISNDGTDEYVMTAYEGSGGYLSIRVFRKSGDRFQPVTDEAPPKPKDITQDGPWFLSDGINPFTGKRELFVRVCGKVYLSFMGSDGSFTREGYLWEKGTTSAACDQNWIDYNRGIFHRLYDAHQYGRAVEFMKSIIDQCGKRIEANQRAWIYNDLALTEFRAGDRQRCRDYLGRASAEKDAAAANPFLAKAISHNESLCSRAASTSSASR